MVEDVEVMNFRKLKCITKYHFVLWKNSQLSRGLIERKPPPQDKQNRIGFSCKANHQMMNFK